MNFQEKLQEYVRYVERTIARHGSKPFRLLDFEDFCRKKLGIAVRDFPDPLNKDQQTEALNFVGRWGQMIVRGELVDSKKFIEDFEYLVQYCLDD